MAEQAIRARQTHLGYLDALLSVELEEREKKTVERRIWEAKLPKVKTLEEFNFAKAPRISVAQIRDLAEGGYIQRAEPVLFIGDCGTGKTHLLSGLCVAACRQKRRVRFTTASALVNELVEAKHQLSLRRVLARWARYELIAIDEVGYVPMADIGAEFLFQIIAERAEKAAVILTTNLPFSEWTAGCSQRAALQSTARQDHGSGAHHRYRQGIVSIPKEPGKTKTQRVEITAAPPKRRRENPGSREPEINNLEWASRNDQSGPRGVVKSNDGTQEAIRADVRKSIIKKLSLPDLRSLKAKLGRILFPNGLPPGSGTMRAALGARLRRLETHRRATKILDSR